MKTYTGSCHCQGVKFEVRLDLSQGIKKCNCTFCYKTKFQKVFATAEDFKLIQGELVDYRGPNSSWPEDHIHHYFCKTCGVRGFSKGYLEMAPFNGWFYAINLATLDNIDPQEIIQAKVIYEDGINDNQMNPPKETRHL